MSDYAVAAGIVQFDVNEKEANGQNIREVTIKTFTSQKLIKVTLWPEFDGVDVKKGDTLFVDGKYNVSLGQGKDGSQREYVSISATQVAVVPGAVKAERNIVQRGAQAASTPSF